VLVGLGAAALLVAAVPWPWSSGSATRAGVASPPPTADATYGKALFSAKGCAVCHYHAGVTGSGAVREGPDLSRYRPDPEFLRRWLRDPSSVRPGTRMATLGLTADEIEAIIAFLQTNPKQAP